MKIAPIVEQNLKKEPGFFFGAMFVSYGLGVAEALITYFICMPF